MQLGTLPFRPARSTGSNLNGSAEHGKVGLCKVFSRIGDVMATDFTRRDFIKLSVGSIALLPAVAGGFLIPDARHGGAALADETTDPIEIVAVSPRQVGFYIDDHSGAEWKRVAGATITITSRYNGKVIQDVTDARGILVVDITELAEEELVDGRYCFNGMIDVVADGYREFHMSLARIEGGLALDIPASPRQAGLPYPARVSFAEWDILYMNTGFVSATGNDVTGPLLIELHDLDKPATATLRNADTKEIYGSCALTPQNGTATGTITETLLKEGSEHALPPKGEFCIQFETDDAIYEFPIALEIHESVAASFEQKEQISVAPCNNFVPQTPMIRIPSYIPLFGNQTLTPWAPQWPIIPIIDPFGYLYISYNSPRLGYVSDNGTTTPKKWGEHPFASSSEQWNSYLKSTQEKVNDVRTALSKGSVLTHAKFSWSITFALSLRMTACATWNWSTGQFSGDATVAALLEFALNLSEQFTFGPVPIYIAFTLNASVVAQALGIGFATPKAFDFGAYDWDYTNTGLSLTVNINPILSAGVGINGVASIGARGTFVFCIFMGITKMPDPDLPYPHYVSSGKGSLSAEVQFFLFKWTGELWNFWEPKLHDNWADEEQVLYGQRDPSEIPGAFRLADGSVNFKITPGVLNTPQSSLWSTLLNDVVPVTLDELRVTNEARVTTLNAELAPVRDLEAIVEEQEDADGFIGGGTFPWTGLLSAGEGGAETSWQTEVLRTPVEVEGTPGVAGVNLELGGINPSMDKIIMYDVFSDPRMKVATYKEMVAEGLAERANVFRLASVEVDGEMRSRVVYQVVDRGVYTPTEVLNFNTGYDEIPRDELFDYDFDLTQNEDGSRFYLFLVSGTRPDPNAETPLEAFRNLMFTYVEFDADYYGATVRRTFSWQPNYFYNIKAAHNAFFCPRVTYLGKDYGNGDDSFVALSWLHRYAVDEASSLDSADAKITVGTAFAWDYGIHLTRFEHDVASIGDNNGYDLAVARGEIGDNGYFNLFYAVRGLDGTAGAHAVVRPCYGNESPFISTATRVPTHPISCHLTPWPGHTGFLANYEKKLVKLDLKADETMFYTTVIGEGEFIADSFGIESTGTYVYYVAQRNGMDEYAFDDKGNPTEVEIRDNRIMACKLYKGSFGEPYTLAHLGSVPRENLVSMGHLGAAVAFLSNAIGDFAFSSADLWYTVVPSVVAPTLLGATIRMPVVAAGDYAHFLVTIRNDGNVHLTGARADLLDKNGQVVSTGFIEFSSLTLQPSVWNPPAELQEGVNVLAEPAPITKSGLAAGPQLLGTDSGYELPPGKTAVYNASLMIPEDWEGTYKVRIRIGDVTWVGADGVSSDSAPIKLESLDREPEGIDVSVTTEFEEGVNRTQNAPVTVISKKGDDGPEPSEDDGSGGGSGSGSGSGGGSGSGSGAGQGSGSGQGNASKTGGATPDMGDAGTLGTAAAALGALGAGMVAYSARRLAVEQEESQEQ